MTTEDRHAFKTLMLALAAAMDFEVDEAVAEGFWVVLNDLPLSHVQTAVHEVMRTSKFRPKASEIREIVLQQLAIENRRLGRQEQISQNYAEAMATNVIRDARRRNADDAEIRELLKLKGQQLEIELYWPGEEPWNKRAEGLPRLELRRA
jgi:hypothetical protein